MDSGRLCGFGLSKEGWAGNSIGDSGSGIGGCGSSECGSWSREWYEVVWH